MSNSKSEREGFFGKFFVRRKRSARKRGVVVLQEKPSPVPQENAERESATLRLKQPKTRKGAKQQQLISEQRVVDNKSPIGGRHSLRKSSKTQPADDEGKTKLDETLEPSKAVQGALSDLRKELMSEIRALRNREYNLTVRVTKLEKALRDQTQELVRLKSTVCDSITTPHSPPTGGTPCATEPEKTSAERKTPIIGRQSKIPILYSVGSRSIARTSPITETPKSLLSQRRVRANADSSRQRYPSIFAISSPANALCAPPKPKCESVGTPRMNRRSPFRSSARLCLNNFQCT